MSKQTIVTFIAKPSHMSFGGNDAFAIHLTRHWPSPEDRLIFTFNATNPCRDIFTTRLKDHAEIVLFQEPMITEIRAAIAARTGGSPVKRFWLEFWQDLCRPFRATACIYRFTRFLARYQPQAILLNVGGNPPEDMGWRMMIAAWVMRVPKIILINQSYPGRGTNFVRSAVLMVLRRVVWFFCTEVVVPSEDTSIAYAKSMGGTRKPVVIPYGVDEAPENPAALAEKRKKLNVTDAEGPIIGLVGNAEDRKGLHILMRAMPSIVAEFPHAQCVLIGFPADPIYAEQLKGLIKELGIEANVKNIGYLQDAGAYFECFDVAVVPSLYGETFGIVAIEAMSFHKPVVASITGGLSEVVVDGETGYRVKPGDVEELTDRLLKLLRAPALRAAMGKKGYQRFHERYRTSAMAQSYDRLVHPQP